MQSTMLIRRRPQASQPDLCLAFCSLYIAARGFSTSHLHHAMGGSNNSTPNAMHSAPPGTTRRARPAARITPAQLAQPNSEYMKMSVADRAAAAKVRADEVLMQQQEKARKGPIQGGLAKGNVFFGEQIGGKAMTSVEEDEEGIVREDLDLAKRSPSNMALRLDPKPNARARWTRTMVIRDIRKRGRLTKVMRIARTERSHLSKSRFLKTSIKKLAPLARQIAGKSLDDAILQMRFSKKKVARDVHEHLIQARNEAIVLAGMNLPDPDTTFLSDEEKHKALEAGSNAHPTLEGQERITALKNVLRRVNRGKMTPLQKMKELGLISATPPEPTSFEVVDPSNTPALPIQTQSKALKKGVAPNPTDLYIAEAWVNRGTYDLEPSPRARGRTDILRHPHTGISVLLKEEKTRTREKQDKEIKAIRKRLNGKLWTQMPDKPITRQSQYVLW